ncbi:MAG: hypothetical protein FWF69_04060 [Firmicutes bacterium]|nr:hypothetical protein [Bacillota bacterium]
MSRRGDIFGKRKHHIGRWVAFFLVCAIAVCGVYTAVDNGRVVVRTQRILVWNLPQALEGFTVLLISDLNGRRFGPNQKQIESALKGKKYNAVCVAGNMIEKRGDASPFLELLDVLDATKPVYFIAGAGDPSPLIRQAGGLITTVSNWVSEAQRAGAVYLDAPVPLQVGKSRVWFSDAEQITLDLESAAEAYARAGANPDDYDVGVVERAREARARMYEDDLNIVLSRYPLREETVYRMQAINEAKGSPFLRMIDVVLAGGTAGGQWRLPFLGPLWAEGWLPRDEYTLGYHYAGSKLQYITGGLGIETASPLPGIRLFNTPEVTLLTFTSAIGEDVLPGQ